MGLFTNLAKQAADADKTEEGKVDIKSTATQEVKQVEEAKGLDETLADQHGVGKQSPPPVEPRHVKTTTMEASELRAELVRDHVLEVQNLRGTDWKELGSAEFVPRYTALLRDIRAAAVEDALSVDDGASLLEQTISERQFALVSVALERGRHLRDFGDYETEFQAFIHGCTAGWIRLRRDFIASLKDARDCGEPMVEAVKEKLDGLIFLCDLELKKFEKSDAAVDAIAAAPLPTSTPGVSVTPAPRQPCEGPKELREASTAEVDAALDGLPADPGAPTVAAPAVPVVKPAPAPYPLQEPDPDAHVQTQAMPATDDSITREVPRTPPPPPPDGSLELDQPTTSFRAPVGGAVLPQVPSDEEAEAAMLAATPPVPPAGPTPPEPNANLAFAPTAAQPATPPEGVQAAPLPFAPPSWEVELTFKIVTGLPFVPGTPFVPSDDGASLTEVKLTKDSITVGRSITSDLLFENPSVSMRHALIEMKDGNVLLTDLRSSNGTFVNGKQVQHATLTDGDLIAFGNQAVILGIGAVLEGTAQAATPAPEPPPAPSPAPAPSAEPPPAPAPQAQDPMDWLADRVTALGLLTWQEHQLPETEAAFRTVLTNLDGKTTSTDVDVKGRAETLIDWLMSARHSAALSAAMGDKWIDLLVDSDTLKKLSDATIKERLQRAEEFMQTKPDGHGLHEYAANNASALRTMYRDETVRRATTGQVYPTPDPAIVHGAGSRPAMLAPAPAPTPPPLPAVAAAEPPLLQVYQNPHDQQRGLPAVAASTPKLTPAATPLAKAAAAPAAPLPSAVITDAPVSLPSVVLSPSLPPQTPHAQRNQPTDPPPASPFAQPGRPGMAAIEQPSLPERVKKSAERNGALLKGLAKFAFYGFAIVAGLGILAMGMYMVRDTSETNRRLVQQVAEVTEQVAAATGANKLPPTSATALANAAPTVVVTPPSSQRCMPAPSPACERLGAGTQITDQAGPGYECPAGDPAHPNGDGSWDVCHCQLCN